jgi:hypothetical protein
MATIQCRARIPNVLTARPGGVAESQPSIVDHLCSPLLRAVDRDSLSRPSEVAHRCPTKMISRYSDPCPRTWYDGQCHIESFERASSGACQDTATSSGRCRLEKAPRDIVSRLVEPSGTVAGRSSATAPIAQAQRDQSDRKKYAHAACASLKPSERADSPSPRPGRASRRGISKTHFCHSVPSGLLSSIAARPTESSLRSLHSWPSPKTAPRPASLQKQETGWPSPICQGLFVLG